MTVFWHSWLALAESTARYVRVLAELEKGERACDTHCLALSKGRRRVWGQCIHCQDIVESPLTGRDWSCLTSLT